MKEPLVSIVLPLHRDNPYLRGALNSIVNQTYENTELIIVDDGSDPPVRGLLGSILESTVARLIRIPHSGISEALNVGFASAKGNYLARMDSDDWSAPERIALQVAYLEANPEFCLVGCSYRLATVSSDGRLSMKEIRPPCSDAHIRKQLPRQNVFAGGACMFRRSAYENTGPFDPEFSGVEDYDMWLRMAQYGKIANLPELLYLHREHPDSISSRNRYQLAGKVRKLWAKNGVRVAPGHFPPAYPRLLSYVVPTWNRPELLRRALKSLAVQTDRRFEVVVVNDGGQDVASIVHGCLKSLPHCSIETESNSGLAAARNHALQHCSSPLVCFLDDDDRVEPIHAELMIDAMANCSHGLVFGGFRYVRLRHTPLGLFSEQEGPEVHKGWNLEKMWVANYIPVGTYVVRKRLLDRLAPVFDPSLPVLEDWDMLLRLSAQATFGCIPYCVAEITESVDNRGGSRAPAVYRHDPQMLTRYDEVQAREALWKKYMESIYARYASPPDLNPNQLARKRHEYLGGAA